MWFSPNHLAPEKRGRSGSNCSSPGDRALCQGSWHNRIGSGCTHFTWAKGGSRISPWGLPVSSAPGVMICSRELPLWFRTAFPTSSTFDLGGGIGHPGTCILTASTGHTHTFSEQGCKEQGVPTLLEFSDWKGRQTWAVDQEIQAYKCARCSEGCCVENGLGGGGRNLLYTGGQGGLLGGGAIWTKIWNLRSSHTMKSIAGGTGCVCKSPVCIRSLHVWNFSVLLFIHLLPSLPFPRQRQCICHCPSKAECFVDEWLSLQGNIIQLLHLLSWLCYWKSLCPRIIPSNKSEQ